MKRNSAAILAEYSHRKERDGQQSAQAWLNDQRPSDAWPKASEIRAPRYNVVGIGIYQYVEQY